MRARRAGHARERDGIGKTDVIDTVISLFCTRPNFRAQRHDPIYLVGVRRAMAQLRAKLRTSFSLQDYCLARHGRTTGTRCDRRKTRSRAACLPLSPGRRQLLQQLEKRSYPAAGATTAARCRSPVDAGAAPCACVAFVACPAPSIQLDRSSITDQHAENIATRPLHREVQI